MAGTQDYTWDQGSDLIINILYKINDQAVDLTDYAVRMDIAPLSGAAPGQPIFSFNSEDFNDDTALDSAGGDDNEVTLDANGNIHIKISRELTLTGAIGTRLALTSPVKEYAYDLFIRNKDTDTQKKLLKGKITVETSITRWA